MAIDPLITPAQLLATPRALLFDVRTGPAARQSYAKGHLPGALFVDLETDLSRPGADAACGGRHPLPAPELFAERLSDWGVAPESDVVVYDDQSGANAAARMWWMLRALGHTLVRVLDGGLSAALKQGFPLAHGIENDSVTSARRAAYPQRGWQLPTADIEAVEEARNAADALVLDVRAAPRFQGQIEPIDPLAGHIPGAHNLPLQENLTPGGSFKDAAQLREMYRALLGGRDPGRLIVHCGSGVTACHTLLALERAGIEGARLYVGSWSEWCRNPGRPRAP